MKNTNNTKTEKLNTTKNANKNTKTKTEKLNIEKTNEKYNDLFEILNTTISNKNELTKQLNMHGYYANMHSKNLTDFTTTNNDLYYQLIDGTRIFFGTNRKKVQIWLTPKTYEIRNELLPNINDNEYTPYDDAIRKYKTLKNIDFTSEWLNGFMNEYEKHFSVKMF